jgi:hypothetical protein
MTDAEGDEESRVEYGWQLNDRTTWGNPLYRSQKRRGGGARPLTRDVGSRSASSATAARAAHRRNAAATQQTLQNNDAPTFINARDDTLLDAHDRHDERVLASDLAHEMESAMQRKVEEQQWRQWRQGEEGGGGGGGGGGNNGGARRSRAERRAAMDELVQAGVSAVTQHAPTDAVPEPPCLRPSDERLDTRWTTHHHRRVWKEFHARANAVDAADNAFDADMAALEVHEQEEEEQAMLR